MRAGRLSLLLALAAAARAEDPGPKTDNEIAALDIRTGRELWSHKPPRLSDARFELYPDGLIAFPTEWEDAREHPIHLAPDTGEVLPVFDPSPDACLARSDALRALERVRLGNGWAYLGWVPRERLSRSGTALFGAPELQGKGIKERAESAGWRLVVEKPSQVLCWKELVLFASDWRAKVRAYRVGGERPDWALDLNQVCAGRETRLRHVKIQLSGDLLLVQAMENVLGVDPASGKILWERDVAKDLGAPFLGGIMGLKVATAAFACDGDVLVIAYENRVIALDTKTQKYLWTMRPDTYPQRPLPAAHNGVIYLSAGKNRRFEAPPR